MYPIKKVATCPAPSLLRATSSLQRDNDALKEELAEVKRMLAATLAPSQEPTGIEDIQVVAAPEQVEHTKPFRTVKISGFLKFPYYYQVLEVVKTGRISAIKRNTSLDNSRVSHSVTVTFVQGAAAKALLYQHLQRPIEIDGRRVDISNPTIDNAEATFVPEATRVLRLNIPLPPSAGLPPIIGTALTPGVDVQGRRLLEDELIMFCSRKEAEYLVSLDFCGKLGDEVLDISRLAGEWKGPMELRIEFLSIAACLEAVDGMKKDDKWMGAGYEFGVDPCGGLIGDDVGVDEENLTDASQSGGKAESTLKPSDSASWAWEFRNPPAWIEGHIGSDIEEEGSDELEIERLAVDGDDFFGSRYSTVPYIATNMSFNSISIVTLMPLHEPITNMIYGLPVIQLKKMKMSKSDELMGEWRSSDRLATVRKHATPS